MLGTSSGWRVVNSVERIAGRYGAEQPAGGVIKGDIREIMTTFAQNKANLPGGRFALNVL